MNRSLKALKRLEEKIDKRIKELNPNYNESLSDCVECEMWSRLFSKQELL